MNKKIQDHAQKYAPRLLDSHSLRGHCGKETMSKEFAQSHQVSQFLRDLTGEQVLSQRKDLQIFQCA